MFVKTFTHDFFPEVGLHGTSARETPERFGTAERRDAAGDSLPADHLAARRLLPRGLGRQALSHLALARARRGSPRGGGGGGGRLGCLQKRSRITRGPRARPHWGAGWPGGGVGTGFPLRVRP